MKTLETDRLVLRNWTEDDRDLFHEINSHEEVMRFFPFRRDRTASDAFMDTIRAANAERGYGFCALALKETGRTIGFAGLSPDDASPAARTGAVEIGWRLAYPYWKKGYASEAARRLLRFGFTELGLDEIVSFAVWNNHASIAVMRRIGMTADPARDFDHPRVPAEMPHLRRHSFHALSRARWEASWRKRGQ